MKDTRRLLLAGLIGAATILATSSASAFWGGNSWGGSPFNWGGWGNSWGNNWGGGPWGGGYPGYGGWGGGYPGYGGYGGYPGYGGWGGGYPYGGYGGYPNYGGGYGGYAPYGGGYTYPSTTTTRPAPAKKAPAKK